MSSISVSSTAARFSQDISIRQFRLTADEPPEVGGDDAGATPTEYVLAGLGACKAITIKMYAERKGWPLEHVAVDVALQKTPDGSQIVAQLQLQGDLTDEQRSRLKEIGDRCPIHKLLNAGVEIQTSLDNQS